MLVHPHTTPMDDPLYSKLTKGKLDLVVASSNSNFGNCVTKLLEEKTGHPTKSLVPGRQGSDLDTLEHNVDLLLIDSELPKKIIDTLLAKYATSCPIVYLGSSINSAHDPDQYFIDDARSFLSTNDANVIALKLENFVLHWIVKTTSFAAEKATYLLSGSRLVNKQNMEVLAREQIQIAREVHDQLGQYIVAIKTKAFMTRSRLSQPDECTKLIDDILDIADRLNVATRNIHKKLSPESIEDLEFESVVQRLTSEWTDYHGINCKATIHSHVESLSIQTRVNLLRIIQESLTNVVKHASAASVAVSIDREDDLFDDVSNSDGNLILVIKDDGNGMPKGRNRQGMGLLNIRERANAMDGSLSIVSNSGGGTEIRVTIPMYSTPTFASNDDRQLVV